MNAKTPNSIPRLLAIFNLLYAAVPATVGKDSSLGSLKESIKTDTRMIVAVDTKFMLMTEFLNIIGKQISDGGSSTKIKDLEGWIERALDGIKDAVAGGDPRDTALYKDKINFFTGSNYKGKKKKSGYELLKKKITNPLLGTILEG